ncbi:hypothetical protein [Legionella saoudiensis]|uniref:hypothetical protein n=1 Tax=Legionella saoudiensis TaxID=1750561 RepID=UPI000B156ED5|nr:hypothetical protein [Legionella saoudiensis]
MDRKDLQDNVSYRHSNKPEKNHPLEPETDKRGERQGGIDKKGNKEKDEKGEL